MAAPEWLMWSTSNDPDEMIGLFRKEISNRKFRLYACACCRRAWDRLPQLSRKTIEAAERFADGLLTAANLDAMNSLPAPDWLDAATRAAAASSIEDMYPTTGLVRLNRDEEVEAAVQARLLRDIFGNPFRPVTVDPAWQTANIVALAQAMYDERAFDRMPILGDALEDAGCTNADVLTHCRQPGEHVRGCWVVDLLLGKE
jgi:hypothetical protein